MTRQKFTERKESWKKLERRGRRKLSKEDRNATSREEKMILMNRAYSSLQVQGLYNIKLLEKVIQFCGVGEGSFLPFPWWLRW